MRNIYCLIYCSGKHAPGVANKKGGIICFLRILSQKICNIRGKKRQNDKSASNERPGIYDTVGENSGYQELGYVSGPSHCD